MTSPANDGQFPTTRWTLIARIKSADEAVAARALEEMCAQYHYPLYCYLRRRGCAHHDAQDVLHDFLALIFRRRDLERLEEARGRLRGYLCTALGRHFQQWRRSESRRVPTEPEFERGLDFDSIEARYQRERFTDADTPDRVFERQWALEILRQVIAALGVRYEERGRGRIYAVLRPVLEAGGSLRGYDNPALAAAAGVSEDALRAALVRLLREFRDALQAEVRTTVESAEELPAELAYLTALFGK
jgi:RNA polymerase sigma-70 factor (ECF subfamily)